jgi:hypothetical protein
VAQRRTQYRRRQGAVGYQAIAASGRDKTATAFTRLVEREIIGFVPPSGFD